MATDTAQLDSAQVEQMKNMARTTWAAGNFDRIANKTVWTVGPELVRRAGIVEGEKVLDVACGTGNATIPAARVGATVTGLDITPELLEIARRRAADEGLEIEFVEGDAEALPFDDASFDVVVSTFGVMFAPRHEVAAAELARVTRPGGRIAIANWTPEGAVGTIFATTASHVGPRPGTPPVRWGREGHARELLGGDFELAFERTTVEMVYDSVDEGVAFFEENFGPMVMARRQLEPQGRWEALHHDIVALWRRDEAPDGSVHTIAEYLVVTGNRRTPSTT